MDIPISKHIFLFPFKWELKPKKDVGNASLFERVNITGFKKQLDTNAWEEYTFRIKEPATGELNPYNEYAYFYDHVRCVLNLNENKNSFQYNYKLPDRNKTIYKISITGNAKELALEIDGIFLNIYDSGVAVLGFILTNRSVTDFNQVLKINEYGRRIYPQFLGASPINKEGQTVGLTLDTKMNFLAEKIELIGLKDTPIKETFSHYDTYTKIDNEPFILPAHIGDLLGSKFKTCTYKKLSPEEIKVTPIIDDRMFVMCFLFDPPILKEISKYDKKTEEYSYLSSDKWYRYIYIDDSTATCASNTMKKNLLADCTYDRWIYENKGTKGHLFGISRYSFVILAAREWFTENVLFSHFSNMYFQIVLLSLVQRASIISYSGEATRIVEKIKKDEELTAKEIKDINSLAQSFIVFKNQIYFREITAQEQGIEIYNKVHQQMNIEKEVEALEAEIEDLISFINTNSETRRSKETQHLTWVATWFLPASVIVSLLGINALDKTNMIWGGRQDPNAWKWIWFAIIASILFGVITYCFMNLKRVLKFANRRSKK